MNASPEQLSRHLRELTQTIGIRLAGSPQELAAAQYINAECRKFTPTVSIERFPVQERCVTSETLEVLVKGHWRKYTCSLFGSSPTTDGEVWEAPLVFFATETDYDRPDLSFLTGKAVVHLGSHIDSPERYQRLMAAKPRFLLFVDTRHTGNVAIADGLFPSYVKQFGALPSLNVAYLDAVSWCENHASQARICVAGGQNPSLTSVTIAELPGTDPKSGVIYVGGHHDTQAGTVGADDNACGSAAVIELTRMLSSTPHRRTFRLCSFGAEEQLSVGSASYVRAHREQIAADGVFMCNFDSFGSAMGWNSLLINGTETLARRLTEVFHAHDIYFKQDLGILPYTDQFPFAAAGVPGIWVNRLNCDTGLFYHHRFDNTIEHLDPLVMAKILDAAYDFLLYLADTADITPVCGIPKALQPAIAREWQAVFGGW